MIRMSLTAGSLRLWSDTDSDTFHLSVKYNNTVTKDIEIRGEDELYALHYLVSRAIHKLESTR